MVVGVGNYRRYLKHVRLFRKKPDSYELDYWCVVKQFNFTIDATFDVDFLYYYTPFSLAFRTGVRHTFRTERYQSSRIGTKGVRKVNDDFV